MQLKKYTQGDEKAILELFELVFKREMSLNYWNWRFRDNPFGKHIITLMWDGNTLVGHYAVSPVKLRVNGQPILTALSMTTMTHPDYGRQGIFGRLASELYSWCANELNIKIIWGFPNNNSHYGFIKNLAWKNIGMLHELSIEKHKLEAFSLGQCRISTHFTKSHVGLLEKDQARKGVSVDKNIDYLTWRYIDNPSQSYIIIEYDTLGLPISSFIVVKKYAVDQHTNIINVVEFGGCHNIKELEVLLSFAYNYFKEPIKECTLWMSLFDKRYLFLEKLGFRPSGKNTYLGFKPLDNDLEIINNLNQWYYTFGDSDVY